MRNPVGAAQPEAHGPEIHRGERSADRAHHEVALVEPHLATTLAFDMDLETVGDDLPDQRVGQFEGKPEAVEAGAEVGAGRWHLDGDRPRDEPCDEPRDEPCVDPPAGPLHHPRSAAAAAASTSASHTVSTRSVKPESAVSMSLSP